MGFRQKWVDWIILCVSIVTYSVLINDQPHGLMILQRGLRQGDPLFPFLFVLCTEGLSHLLNKAEMKGRLNGIQFSSSGHVVHHLLFAYDSLFICKAELSQCFEFLKIMDSYEVATGQTMNLDKSAIAFGSLVDSIIKAVIQDVLGIQKEGGVGTYLGLPECFSGSKIDMLDYLKSKFKARLLGWFARTLSQ